MKKAISFLSLLILNINFILAQDYLSSLKNTLQDSLINPTENLLVIQIVLFLLFFALIFTTLQKSNFLNDKKITAIVSLAVSLLAIYYLSQEMLSYILTSYTALGLIITTFLPLMIILFFIHRSKMTRIGRKIVLVVFSVFLAYLWYKHFKETGDLWNEIHLITAAAILASLAFDKDLHKMLKKQSPRE